MNAKNRRGVSPVIATVILVAVAITITIAVAYWMSGIAGGYTKFEKIEMSSVTCSAKAAGIWTITASVKNTGSAPATLTTVLVNQFEVDHYSALVGVAGEADTDMSQSKTMDPGATGIIKIWISDTYPPATKATAFYTSGTTLNIKLHSAGGMDYIKVVELV